MKREAFMHMWVVYDHPRDFPDSFVARRHDVIRGDLEPVVTEDYRTAQTLDEIRQLIPPGHFRMGRFDKDDPSIVEVWL